MVYKQNFIKMSLLQAEKENCPKIVQKMTKIVWKKFFIKKTYFAGQKIIKYIFYFFSQKNEFLIWRKKNCPKIVQKLTKLTKTKKQPWKNLSFLTFLFSVLFSFIDFLFSKSGILKISPTLISCCSEMGHFDIFFIFLSSSTIFQ